MIAEFESRHLIMVNLDMGNVHLNKMKERGTV